jgi:hypothetical protein
MSLTFRFPGFQIDAADDWRDITESLNNPKAPPTLAMPDGVGALQFSLARYKTGTIPSPTIADLLSMVREFADNKDLDEPFDEDTFSEDVMGAGASFKGGEDLIRVWYISDGKNFVLVTYVCGWESRDTTEVQECNSFVRNIRFIS